MNIDIYIKENITFLMVKVKSLKCVNKVTKKQVGVESKDKE